MMKSIKVSFGALVLGASVVAPVSTVFLNSKKHEKNPEENNKSIWNPISIVDPYKSLSDQNIKNTIKEIQNYGNYEPWKTVTLDDNASLSAISPNEFGNFWISNAPGVITTINNQGKKLGEAITGLLGNRQINAIATDNNGGFYVAGQNGLIDHINKDNTIDQNWQNQVFLNGQNINVILSDYEGGLYLAGDNGLFDHVDASGKTKLNSGAHVALDGMSIKSMIYDNENDLMIGGQNGTIARIDFQGNCVIKPKQLISGQDILQIVPTEDKNYIVIGNNSELNVIDSQINTLHTEKPFGDIEITAIYPNNDGDFFVGNKNGQITLIDKDGKVKTGFETRNIASGSISNIIADGIGGFIITSNDNKINHIDRNGLVYGFNSWIINSNDEKQRYEEYRGLLTSDWQTQTIFSYSSVRSLLQLDGGKFVASGAQGNLQLFNPDGTLSGNWKGVNYLNNNDIATIAKSSENSLFIAGAGNVVQEVNINGEIINSFENPLGNDIYKIITDGNDGFIVIGGQGSFAHVDNTFKIIDQNNLQGNYFTIIPDGLGNYFVGGNNGQLLHINKQGEPLPNWKIPNLISYQSINAMIPDGNGNLLIGGTSGKFAQVDYNGNLISEPSQPLLQGGRVLNIIDDGNGDFLVAGDRGIIQRVKATGEIIQEHQQTIEGANINDIIADDQGGFWVAGDAGKIDHINYEGATSKAESEEETYARWNSKSKITLTTDFSDVNFSFDGKNNQGTVYFKNEKNLPRQLNVEYSNDNGTNWSAAAPVNLKNGDSIMARLVVKDEYANQFDIDKLIPNPITLTVSGLSTKIVLTTKLNVNNFSFSGVSTESSTVSYSEAIDHLEILYSIDEGHNWSNVFPNNLKNNDSVKAKLSVLPADEQQYTLDPASTIPVDLIVNNLSKIQLSDKLNVSDFKFEGFSGSGSLTFEPSKPISPLLTVEYKLNNANWSKAVPNNIRSSDAISVRLALKTNDSDVYDYDQTELPLSVNIKKIPLSDEISNRDFVFSGTTGSGTIAFEPSIALSDKLEVQYSYKNGPWSTNIPTKLTNGETLKAHLAIKQGFENDYTITGPNTEVVWTIKLDKIALKDVIHEADFRFSGQAYSGTVNFQPTTPLSEQIEVQYSFKDGHWSTDIPTNLSNSDSPLLARLAIKQIYIDQYRLDPIVRENTVLNFELKKIVLNDPIKDTDFVFTGAAKQATMTFNPSPTLDTHVGIEYSLNSDRVWSDIAGGTSVNLNLKNGDHVFVRSKITSDNANYDLSVSAKSGLDLTIKGLAKIMLQDKLSSDDFVFSGEDTKGKVSLSPNRFISSLLKVQYSKDGIGWSDDAPADLKNGDQLKARLFLKAPDENYDVDSTAVDLTVKDLPFLIKIHDKLEVNDFVITGFDKLAKITVSPNLWLPEQVTIQYSIDNATWAAIPPQQFLKNGDVVYTRLALKEIDSNGNSVDYSKNYEIVNKDALKITISNLKKAPENNPTPIKKWIWGVIGVVIAIAVGTLGYATFFWTKKHKKKSKKIK